MYKTIVGVLRGGPSDEYEVSLKTGQSVISSLLEGGYEVKDILIDRNGEWYMRGVPVEPARVFNQVDVVFNALHGKYGEDGTVQRLLDTNGVKYTGSDALSSAIAMNKVLTKEVLKNAVFKHAQHHVLRKGEIEENTIVKLWRTFPQPCVVKPATGGSSVATRVVYSFDDFVFAIASAFCHADIVLIEQYIKGREATVAVADAFRGEDVYTFPPVEIMVNSSDFFDYDEKYGGVASEVCPAHFDSDITDALIDSAKYVHNVIGLRDYSRSDFIVASDGVYFLEVNTLPGLTQESLVPKSVSAVGATLPQFLTHLVELAKKR